MKGEGEEPKGITFVKVGGEFHYPRSGSGVVLAFGMFTGEIPVVLSAHLSNVEHG